MAGPLKKKERDAIFSIFMTGGSVSIGLRWTLGKRNDIKFMKLFILKPTQKCPGERFMHLQSL